jgi:hypothetical protein
MLVGELHRPQSCSKWTQTYLQRCVSEFRTFVGWDVWAESVWIAQKTQKTTKKKVEKRDTTRKTRH